MKNHPAIILLSSLLLVGACKKSSRSSTTTPTTTTTTTTSPYYFKFTFNGVSSDFNANIPQYITFYTNVVGGYQVANANLEPSIGLSFNWPAGDTVRESDIMGLAGRTLYFNDPVINLDLTFDSTFSSNTWESDDTSSRSYYVKVTSVTFLKKDTVLGTPIRAYVISGSCSAVMSVLSSTSILSAGSFNFIVSRMDL